ncbi:GGDEF domain-containing protein [Ruminococcaceae bacterium OttesenSCG-928-L11]|nr:GGDEF domain-containing protein [Ruminococcaceae bacterium OttesenSCG-928-L11]
MRKGVQDSSKELFVDVMDRLSAQQDPYRPIHGILADACRCFGFGCGFVYESDHTGKFALEERFCNYSNDALKQTVYLQEYLGGELLAQMATRPVVFFPTRTVNNGELDMRLAELFEANSLLIVSVVGTSGNTEAIVGMSDRRGRILLSGEEISVARSILTVVANHIKLRMYQRTIENSRKALESVLDNMGIDVYVNDFNTHEILYVNQSMAAPYGDKESLIGKKCWGSLYDDKDGQCEYCPQKKLIDDEGNPTKVYSWDYERPFDKAWFRVFSAAFQWTDGRLAHVVSSVDISENKRNEAIIRKMADYDTLTNLPNRRKLLLDMDSGIKRMAAKEQSGYVLFLDLDDFKQVNDTMGHRAGDELLVMVAQFLMEHPLTRDKCYRHSGDEFVLLCENTDKSEVDAVIELLLQQFSQPWSLTDGEAVCPASIGAAQFPADGTETEALLHNADMAMYFAKRNGKHNVNFYTPNEVLCDVPEAAAGES